MKVVITSKLPNIITNYLEDIRIDTNSIDEPLPPIRLRQMMSDTDALICTSSDIIDRPLMEAAPKLKVIVNYDAGSDNIDIDYATHRGITVCTTKHILTQSTAELGFALLMSAARHIPEADKYARNGRFSGNTNHSLMTGLDFYKKTWEPGMNAQVCNPRFGRLRQEDCKFKARLDYVRICLKKKNFCLKFE